MEQMTVKQLYKELEQLVKDGMGDKKIILSDDTEGNGYHGCFFSCTSQPKAVKECIDASNGVYETDSEDPNELVIIG